MRARDLVLWYRQSLEQQILVGGSSLVCRDEDLLKKVEAFLREGDAHETHCLALDPLEVMEESLRATAPPGLQPRRASGGLEALAKAFEVLEQAALNLHLGPWREEYKVVKMHSGMFTHYIKPVLSPQQICFLFGLLGYQHCSAPHEQLRLQPPANDASDLLRLACSFFLGRCECRLLLSALGRHSGEAQWELNLVGERRRGCSLQVSLTHTQELLDVTQPLKDDAPYLDLYTDKQVNGGHREKSVEEDESPKSLTWQSHTDTSPTTVLPQSSGAAPSSCSFSSLPQEPVCGSNPRHTASRSFSARTKQGRHSRDESPKLAFDAATVCERSLPSEAKQVCSSMQSAAVCVGRCVECDTVHDSSHAALQKCRAKHHGAPPPQDEITEAAMELRTATGQSRGQTAAPPLTASALCDGRDSPDRPPITYHECCDLASPDPRTLCSDCRAFHAVGCRRADYCRKSHKLRLLDRCSMCQGLCVRKPLVLCRYCGAEYCSSCWYRHPIICVCGQTFDQSSSV
ncbi:spermatogenesis associated 2-like [Genypterus blacodes]|uniref:spermatogenesis associated 2-like n=1 Tax=Genypterus blacodes TaxID=154954 RepID=UPI003F771281